MSSWGDAWGESWGDSWGAITIDPNAMIGTAFFSFFAEATGSIVTITGETTTPGGVGSSTRHRRPQVAVVEYDGTEYRVPVANLQSFLDFIKEKSKTPKPVKIKKKGRKKKIVVENTAPQVVIKDAPVEFKVQAQAWADRSNEILEKIWQGAISRYLQELEDEECLLMLML